jgi:hypothetical protein
MSYDLDSVLTGLANRYVKFGIRETQINRFNPKHIEIEDTRILAGFIDPESLTKNRNIGDRFCKEAFVGGYKDLICLAGYYLSLGYIEWTDSCIGAYMFNVGRGLSALPNSVQSEYLKFLVRIKGKGIFELIAYGACLSGNVKLFKLCGKRLIKTGFRFEQYRIVTDPKDTVMIACIKKYIEKSTRLRHVKVSL